MVEQKKAMKLCGRERTGSAEDGYDGSEFQILSFHIKLVYRNVGEDGGLLVEGVEIVVLRELRLVGNGARVWGRSIEWRWGYRERE